jgi:hypothetical protein
MDQPVRTASLRTASALRRTVAKRAAQRGTAIFIVLMIITLLTTLGLFAVRSSSLSTMSSGYYRQATQTHYIADLALTSFVGFLDDGAQAVSLKMTNPSKMDITCVAYGDLTEPSCAKMTFDDLEKSVTDENGANKLVVPLSGGVPGSLGNAPLEADMAIEVTDWHPAWPPVAGSDANQDGFGHVMVTVTVNGMVRPEQAVDNTWDTAAATAAGVETTRAHILMGPVTY